jgi:hypothetical protein
MNPWLLLKRQFQRNENEGNGQKTFTRLIDLAASQLQGGNYVEARELLLKALEYKTEIQEPIILEWILSWLPTRRVHGYLGGIEARRSEVREAGKCGAATVGQRASGNEALRRYEQW